MKFYKELYNMKYSNLITREKVLESLEMRIIIEV